MVSWYHSIDLALKVHKRDNFFGSDFEFSTFLLLVILKNGIFVTKNVLIGPVLRKIQFSCVLY